MAVSVLRLKITLLDSSAEGEQVAVGLDLLAELVSGEARGQDCEEVTKHQRVQFGRPARDLNEVWVRVIGSIQTCNIWVTVSRRMRFSIKFQCRNVHFLGLLEYSSHFWTVN